MTLWTYTVLLKLIPTIRMTENFVVFSTKFFHNRVSVLRIAHINKSIQDWAFHKKVYTPTWSLGKYF